MPAPQKSMFASLAKTNFALKGIVLPIEWEDPGKQYPDAFSEDEKVVAPNAPMNLFREESLNKYHVKSAKVLGEQFDQFIESTCAAICDGIDKWMKLVTVSNVVINGPIGTLIPGCVLGPPLSPLILATAPKNTPQELKYSNAIANAFGSLWQPWHMGLSGILSYPTFAAFPGPMAPPTPNVPIPLITFTSAGETGLSPGSLKSMMEANLAEPDALHSSDLFDAISQAFNTVFQLFKTSTLIQNVQGTGPIPTFAPPFVPVGPVLAGTVLPVPGAFR